MSQEDWDRLADAEYSHDEDTARTEVSHWAETEGGS